VIRSWASPNVSVALVAATFGAAALVAATFGAEARFAEGFLDAALLGALCSDDDSSTTHAVAFLAATFLGGAPRFPRLGPAFADAFAAFFATALPRIIWSNVDAAEP